MTQTTAGTTVTFTESELDLLVDAFASLFYRSPVRRDEIIAFGIRHPAFDLIYRGGEPEAEEDR